MEEERVESEVQEESGYQPRPMWHVWLARIGLVLFIIVLALFYYNLIRGGR